MKILLVNEAGCFAPGVTALAKVLSLKHRVCIVAPLSKHESCGHSFTACKKPLRVQQYYILRKVKVFSVDGTPCDCVALALDKILKSKPDVIISGISSHSNRGETIYSSGDVSAAIEGTIHGIPSISVSSKVSDAGDEDAFLPVARSFAQRLDYFTKNLPEKTTLNVNYPLKFTSKNIKCVNLTNGIIANKYLGEVNPYGIQFYWLKTPVMGFGLDALEQKGDVYWIKKNFITVTPLKLNLTDHSAVPVVEAGGIKL